MAETILIVHGTFSNESGDLTVIPWWKPQSVFCVSLDRALQSLGVSARTWVHARPDFKGDLEPLPEFKFLGVKPDAPLMSSNASVFSWSGANSELQRRLAARELIEEIKRLEQNPHISKWHIIGHSHGGNIIRRAVRDYPFPVVKGGRCVLLGTPIMSFNDEGRFRDFIRRINWPILSCIVLVATAITKFFNLLMELRNPYIVMGPFYVLISLFTALAAYFSATKSPLRKIAAVNIVFASDEAIALLRKCAKVVADTHLFLREAFGSAKRQDASSSIFSVIARWPVIGPMSAPVILILLVCFHPAYRPHFRMFFRSRLVFYGRGISFISEYTSSTAAPEDNPYYMLGTVFAQLAVWISYCVALPFDVVFGCIDWLGQVLARISMWLGLKMAAKSAFGIDILGSGFDMKSVGSATQNIIEHKIANKVEADILDKMAARDNIRGLIATALLAEGATVLSMEVTRALRDINLLHAQYYQDARIIGHIAKIIAGAYEAGQGVRNSVSTIEHPC